MKISKLISIVLTIVLTLGVLTCTSDVFAYDGDEAVLDEACGLVEALDIDVKIGEGDSITRAEFVYALMQAVKCTAQSDDSLPYSDVSTDHFAASSIRYALDMGVISEAQHFYPDAPVTWPQAAKMLVNALGRDIEASLKGGWPYGYMSVANQAELAADTAISSADDVISKTDIFILLKNFLESYMYETDGIKGGSFVYAGDRTVLEVYFGVYTIEGVVTSNSYTSLYDSNVSADKGFVEIDEISYSYHGICKVGDFVKAYVKEKASGAASEIIFVDNSSSDCFTLDSEMIESVGNGKLEYRDENDNIKRKSIIAHPAVIYNGKAWPDFDIASLSDNGSRIEAVDNNDDGKIDVIRVYEASVMYVDSVDVVGGVIVDKNEGVINLTANSDISYSVLSNGSYSDLSAIVPSSVITYYVSQDGELFEFITDSETISGTFEEFDSGMGEYTVAGNKYRITDYFKKYYLNNFTIGSKVKLILSADGRIVALGDIKSANKEYAYLIAVSLPKGMETNLKAKLFTKDDGIQIYEIAPETLLNGERTSDISYVYTFLTEYIARAEASMNNHLTAATPKYTFITSAPFIRFSAGSDGVIKMIDTADSTGQLRGDEEPNNSLTRYAYPDDKVNTTKHIYSGMTYLRATKILHPYFKIDETADVFVVNINDGVDENKKYTYTDGSYFQTHTAITTARFIPYDVDKTGQLGAVVVYTGSTGAGSLNDESPAGVVVSVTKAIAPDEEEGIKITLLKNGEYVSYYISDPEVLKGMILDTSSKSEIEFYNPDLTFDNPGISAGDYLRIECDSRNIISVVGKEFDAKTSSLLKTFENHGGSEIDYYYGKIYAKGNGIISMVPTLLDSFESDKELGERTRYTFNVSDLVSVCDTETQKVSVAVSGEILSYLIAGDNCHSVLVKLDKNAAVADMVIYK